MDDDAVRQHMASQLTDELVVRLSNETDSIWEDNPRRPKHLKPALTT
jgi:hypothetical protein